MVNRMMIMDFRRIMAKHRNYTLQGWIRYIRLKITWKTLKVTVECAMCGRCCRRISLESNGRWIRSEKEFRSVVDKYPEYRRLTPVERDPQGFLLFTCSWFLPEGICRNHASRLSVCREFPHYSLYFLDGDMPKECGYGFKVVSLLKNSVAK